MTVFFGVLYPDVPKEDVDRARSWMTTTLEDDRADHPDLYDCDGTVLRTPLAEQCAEDLDLCEDDADATIPDWVFDLAHDVASEYEHWDEDVADYGDDDEYDDEGESLDDDVDLDEEEDDWE